ncbi:MAG TPA: PD-(D/E)XK nuclease-like domain-containing protein, partial [Acidobacteriaceae bacterium]|nr:PD-(D/E)XK nuclease-like domain-containing protein [Acidobacteriaceae bacterium]
TKRAFDFGHAAHRFVLGEGEDIVPVDADDWRTKAAKEQAESARAEGKVPLLRAEFDRALAMANALQDNPDAAALFKSGRAEHAMYATDTKTGVRLRGRADWLTETNGQLVIVDYKTAASADPDTFERASTKYKYYLQAAWYRELVIACGLSDDPDFVLVAQEKQPPYLSSVMRFDDIAIAEGRALKRQAVTTYARCLQTGEWPGYPSGTQIISVSPWAYSEDDIEMKAV